MQFKIGDIVVFKDPRSCHILRQDEFVKHHGIGPFVIKSIDNDYEYVYIDTPKIIFGGFRANRFELYTMFIDD